MMDLNIPKNFNWCAVFETDFFEKITSIEHNEIIRIKPAFTIKIEPTTSKKILETITASIEHGGIFVCRPIMQENEKLLNIEDVIFVKNISKNYKHEYKPHINDWQKAMKKILVDDKAFPIEFHSHPILRKDKGMAMYEYWCQMGASPADQFWAESIVAVGNCKIAIPQAILIKDIQTSKGFFIGIYGGLIAPKDFDPQIMKAGGEKAFELGKIIIDNFSKWRSNPDTKSITNIIGIVAGAALIFYPRS